MTELTRDQLIEKLEAADTKDELEALGKAHLGTDVDKRGGLESIRMKLVEKAESIKPASEAAAPETADTETPKGPEKALPEDEAAADSNSSEEPTNTVTPPALDDEDDGDAEDDGDKPEPATRTLLNTKNGRKLAWTAALARLSHMREV